MKFVTAWTDNMTQVTKYKRGSMKRREPDSSILKTFDAKITAFSGRVQNNEEIGFRADYEKSSLKFWQGGKNRETTRNCRLSLSKKEFIQIF
tara:strand:- start:1357 stop:1632 length:276 start_codon:yes stop_codon:yes gene_type:complete